MGDDLLSQEIEQQNLSGANEGNTAANDNVSSPKGVSSSSNSNDQSTPSLSTPTPAANPPRQGGLIAPDLCGGALGVCAIVDLGLPGTPIDLPIVDSPSPSVDDLVLTIDVLAPPIDVLAPPTNLLLPVPPPPTPVTVLDNPEPGSGLPPIFTPEPLKPIPEASTWVMTIIGFSLMAFAFRKKRRPRFNPISIIDVSEVKSSV